MSSNKVGAVLATSGLLTDIDSVAVAGAANVFRNAPGTLAEDESGNTYIYLQGIGSTVVGSCVTYGLSATSAFLTALSVTGAKGPVAFAMAAVLASQFGWYQIGGLAQALFNGAAVAGAKLYSASTGKVDDAVVGGDQIDGAIVAATVGGSGLGAVYLQNPFMNGQG
jgi:hypothetical protein